MCLLCRTEVLLNAYVDLMTAATKPASSPSPKRFGFLKLLEPENFAVEFTRSSLALRWRSELDVIKDNVKARHSLGAYQRSPLGRRSPGDVVVR